MARVFIDGFESGNADLWTPISGTPQVAAYTERDGAYSLHLGNATIDRGLPANASYYVGFKLYVPGYAENTSSYPVIAFYNGTTALGCIRIKSTRELQFNLGNSAAGVIAGEAVGVTKLTGTNILHNIEWYYLPRSDSTGRSILKVNGITQFDFTGVTAPSTTNINILRLDSQSSDNYFDNIVVDNASWPGTTRIQAIWPTAAGANSGFTPSVDAVANYTMVDERPASDTDYVRTNTSDALDTYGMSNFVPPQADVPWKIKCIQPQARAMYEGISAVTQLNMAVKTGGTVYESASLPLTTIWSGVGAVMEQNPNTSVDWTIAEIDGLEAGYRAKI